MSIPLLNAILYFTGLLRFLRMFRLLRLLKLLKVLLY